jgi:ABC-type polysaccharide/polyol phosphate transport system ATPase subunit
MSQPVIRVEHLGKLYRLGALRARPTTMRDAIAGVVAAPLRNLRHLRGLGAPDGDEREDAIWALRDVSFEVRHGEVLGIVGSNGAGKSTLLKVLSRITSPTTGRAWVQGRIGSLLEVGTGFHPELTGRDNIYLNGAILGMERGYIASRFDEIVAFAEVERFLDTPVKHYSSGMYLRLAFAVAAHLPAEILVIDEVLAVGDASFQKKCLAKMSEVASEGRTVLFVSHNLSAIQRMCPRSVLLQGGRLTADGGTADVLRRYLADAPGGARAREWIDLTSAPRTGTGEVLIQAVQYDGGDQDLGYEPTPDGPLDLNLVLTADGLRTLGSVGVSVHDQQGVRLVGIDTRSLGVVTPVEGGRNVVCLRIESLHLTPGVYQVALWAAGMRALPVYDRLESAFALQVVDPQPRPPGQGGLVTCRFHIIAKD